MIYLLPTHLTSDEVRLWEEKTARLARVTRIASEADFIVGNSTSTPSVQAVLLPDGRGW